MRIRTLLFFSAVLTSLMFSQSFWPGNQWPTSDPSALGFIGDSLAAIDADLASGKYGFVDRMFIIRHGKVAYDRSYVRDYAAIYSKEAKTPGPLNAHDPTGPYNYYNPWWHPYYRGGNLHSLQSVTKTITSVIIGVATTRKEFPGLDTPVLHFFDTTKVANIDARKRSMTVRHLLTMTAGFDWNENLPYQDPNNTAIGMEASADWIAFTIDRPMAHEPGSVFAYNSGASQLLSHIFRVATGSDIEEYAVQHLFKPLGIMEFFWKRTPSGPVDTEGGLYLKSEDLARIYYLFLKEGVWEGKRVLDKDWITTSVSPLVTVAANGSAFYGLKWWLFRYDEDPSHLVWAGSGFGGQIPMVIPQYDLVIVFNAWNIRQDGPRLRSSEAVSRVLHAIAK